MASAREARARTGLRFPHCGTGAATPYGVYDLGQNAGWIDVGMNYETAAFAVESIRRWWNEVGKPQYPEAMRLLISADGGCSNGSACVYGHGNCSSWLMRPACRSGSATATGNEQLEQDRASSVCLDLSELAWQAEQGLGGDPTLIAATTTEAGLTVQYQLDTNPYPTGRKVSDEEIASLSIQPRPSKGMELYHCASKGLKLIP